MTATHPTFAFQSGDTWTIDASLHDASNNALNLDGVAIEWTLRDAAGKLAATRAIGNGITVTDAAKGTCRIEWPSGALAAASYYDQLKVTLPDNRVTTQSVGRIDVSKAGPPPAAEFTLADWTAINKAIAMGMRSVRYSDRSVEYSTTAEMFRVRNMIGTSLGLIGTKPTTVRTAYSDGRKHGGRRGW